MVHAVRTAARPQIDGVLDEALWTGIDPVSGFRQRWPVDGAPASERTEVRIAYDDHAIYFGLVMFDSEPERIMRSILHREGRIDKDDRVIIALDTYHDRRSAYVFELNPFGTQGDAHFTNEQLVFPNDWMWEGVYQSEARITDRGWELEVAIPLTTIRFEEKDVATMGVAVYRSIRRKNEEVTWPHISIAYTGTLEGGMDQASQFATLAGLEGLRPGRHLEVKPFAILGGQKRPDLAEAEILDDIGVDVKYSITPGVTLDLTYNTDFAQVEADNVQINLTRFGLFYPEKREFFLERSDLFQFGSAGQADVFFSRRVGIQNDIVGGGRLTGQAGPFSVGILSLQTADGDATAGANNSVIRVRGDVGPRATVGGILTNMQNRDFAGRAAGVDGRFRFFSSSGVSFWLADSWNGDGVGGTTAGFAGLTLRNAKYQAAATYTDIGANFDPALGFVQRRDMVRWQGEAGVTPRFPESSWARSLRVWARGTYIEGQDGRKQSDEILQQTALDFDSGERIMVGFTRRAEVLDMPFAIRPDVVLEAGAYDYGYVGALFRTNLSRPLAMGVMSHVGDFWNGSYFQFGADVTWKTGPHLELTGSVNRNQIDLPVQNGDFNTTILSMNVLGALSRKLFANALIQYDNVSETVQANVRIDWIHTPGSDLFLVLDTGYFSGDLLNPRNERWIRRTGVVKVTYMKAF
ncbi:MAG TPA: DUF5916 domain-containing protein [Longimicrobiales bacterium]|nr:DUF5916 domain-containing protein [Longimicrobiales bacterium]